MSATKHEWRISHEATGTFIRTESGGLVCSLEAGSQDARNRHAALIAAAPTMLEALEAAATYVQAYAPPTHWDKLEALINNLGGDAYGQNGGKGNVA